MSADPQIRVKLMVHELMVLLDLLFCGWDPDGVQDIIDGGFIQARAKIV